MNTRTLWALGFALQGGVTLVLDLLAQRRAARYLAEVNRAQ